MAKEDVLSWKGKDFKYTVKEGWIHIDGVALEVGTSKNDRNYKIDNLEDNDGKEFNVIVGHREDYDNPDHIVGEGKYILDGDKLRYEAKVKDTKHHPDITEQVKDGLVSVSVQGGFEAEEKDDGTVDVKGLDIPLLAMVGKHVRGVDGASIEAVIEERLLLNRKAAKESQEEMEEMRKKQEGINMTEEKVKVLEEQLKQLKEQTEVLQKAKTDAETKVDTMEKEQKLSEKKAEDEAKEAVVDLIIKENSELKKTELLEKSLDELKLMEAYEKKLSEKKDGASEVTESSEDKGVGAKNSDELKGIVVEKDTKNITMSESRRKEFNKEMLEGIYR